MKFLPCGSRALLIELSTLDDVLRLAAAIDAARCSGALPEVVDVTPGARTVLVVCRDEPGSIQRAAHRIGRLPTDDVPVQTRAQVELPVVYDGPDLEGVARELGVGPRDVIERHTARPWIVAFTGFSPGFGYLAGGHPGLQVSRRAEPRTRVAPGSVGLAGEFSCVYPRESPGGWRLIGRTSVSMFDVHLDGGALLKVGTAVNFVEVPQ